MELSSSALVSLDSGAAAILRHTRRLAARGRSAGISQSILTAVRHLRDSNASGLQSVVPVGVRKFTCRTYLLEMHDPSQVNPLVAVLLEPRVDAPDVIAAIGRQYELTRREQEVLRGLASGLSNQALAAQMSIKRSTLLAFLRLIKIKMGVINRAGIMTKILDRISSDGLPL